MAIKLVRVLAAASLCKRSLNLQILTLMKVVLCAATLLTLTVQGTSGQTLRQEYKRSENRSHYIQENKSTIYLMVMAPYPPNVTWDGGPGLIPAARLAVELINNRTDILCDHKLALIEIDSGCNRSDKALLGYTKHLFHSGKNIVGIVGPACSNVAMLLGKLSVPSRAPLVEVTIGTSRRLQNRTQYPFVFMAVSSADIYVKIVLQLAVQYNWKKIGVVVSAYGTYFKEIRSTLLREIEAKEDMELEVVSLPLFGSISPIADIIESEIRIVWVLAPPRLTDKFMCDAYKHTPSLSHPAYQWLFVDRSQVSYENSNSGCSKAELTEAFDGSVLLHYIFETRENTTRSGLSFQEYEKMYREKVKEHEQETGLNITEGMPHSSVYAPVYYDAVWAFGLGLDSVAKSGSADFSSKRKPDGNESLHLAETLKEHLYALRFEGASGTIKFDRVTGQGNSEIELKLIRDGTTEVVGYSDNKPGNVTIIGNFTFIDGTFDERMVSIPVAIASVELATTSVLFILAVVVHILSTVFANRASVKASSPLLNHFIFFGYYIMAIGIMTYVLTQMYIFPDHQVEASLCVTYQWELSIGLTLILATLCMKTWRIYRIFIHYRSPGGKLLTNPVLMVFVVLLLIPVVVTLICLTFFDTVSWETTTELNLNDIDDNGSMGPVFEIRGDCGFPIWFVTVDNLYSSLLLVFALCLAILSRRIHKRYRTIKSISALIYSQTVITGLAIPVVYITKVHITSWGLHHILSCIYLEGLLFLCLIFLFVPPLIPVICEKWTSYRSRNPSRRGSELNSLTINGLKHVTNVSLLFKTNVKPYAQDQK